MDHGSTCTRGWCVVSDEESNEGSDGNVTPGTGSSTAKGGKLPSSVDNLAENIGTDPVKSALQGARGIARGSLRPRSRRKRTGSDRGDTPRGGYSGAWPDGTDPSKLGDVFAGYLDDRGWQRPIAEARVFTDWAQIVGADVAAHCAPVSLRDGELSVSAESTAWATQLRLLGGTLLARVVAELGPTVVTRILVTGPSGPSWRHGKYAVRGHRGPRDTYG
jgi:predicted nucleic acid-binding Zn ribbon protein